MAIVTDARQLTIGQRVFVKALNGALYEAKVEGFMNSLLGGFGQPYYHQLPAEYLAKYPAMPIHEMLEYTRIVKLLIRDALGVCFECERMPRFHNDAWSEVQRSHFHVNIDEYMNYVDLWSGIVFDSSDDGPPPPPERDDVWLFADGTTKSMCEK